MRRATLLPRIALLVGLVASITALVVFRHRRAEVNPASRYATIDSLVHRGTYVIDDSRYVTTIDKIRLQDRFYSSKPPVLPTLLAGPYAVWVQLTGRSFDTDERATLYFINGVGAGLPYLALLVYVYLLMGRWGLSPRVHAMTYLSLVFSYLGLAYATTVNNHTVAALALTAAWYHGWRAREAPEAGPGHWLAAGCWAGLLPTLELWGALFSVSLMLLLLRADWRRTLLLFIPAALPWIILHLGLTYAILGSFRPAYLRPELYLYPGSAFVNAGGMDALREPKSIYLFHMLLGHHGIFSMTPVFLVAVAGAWRRARRTREAAWDVASVLLPWLGCVVLIVAKTRNYGGSCAGMRWLLFAMPLLYPLVGDWLQARRAWLRVAVVAVLVVASGWHVADALRGPYRAWNLSRWQRWLERQGWGSLPVRPPPRSPHAQGA